MIGQNYKEEFIAAKVSPDWRDYYNKTYEWVVKLDCGLYYLIERPDIVTRFCYGYGWCARATNEDEDRAWDAAMEVSSKADTFISENLKEESRRWIDRGALEDKSRPIYACYYEESEHGDCALITEQNYFYWQSTGRFIKEKVTPLTDSDRASILYAYNKVEEHFVKRLNSYLKRYGLEKVNSWAFLRD